MDSCVAIEEYRLERSRRGQSMGGSTAAFFVVSIRRRIGCFSGGFRGRERVDPGKRLARSRGAAGRSSGAMSNKAIVLLADEAPIAEMEELRGLIAEGHERGFLT